MPSLTRKVQVKSAYKNNWRTRRNKQSGPQRNISPLHPAQKKKSKKSVSKPLNSNSEGNPDY